MKTWVLSSGSTLQDRTSTEMMSLRDHIPTEGDRVCTPSCTLTLTDTRYVAYSVMLYEWLGKLELFAISKRMKEKQHKNQFMSYDST